MDNNNATIAHLSDLHLTGTEKAARSERRLLGALKGMNAAFREIAHSKPIQRSDLILITGDITDRGEHTAWRVFWNTVNEAGLGHKLLVLPGNHDICCLGARPPCSSNRGYRKSDLEKAVRGLRIGQQPFRFPWARKLNDSIVVFGLNSNNLGNLSAISNALGMISFYQLEAFARLLKKHRDTQVKIVALHHSPNIPQASTTKKRYKKDLHKANRLFSFMPQDQRRALRLLCISHGVRLIIHGHVHLAEDRRVNGVRIIGAPPTTQPIDATNEKCKYQFYSYNVHGRSGRINTKLETV